MWTKKSIMTRIASSESKLKDLYTQIDQLHSKLARQSNPSKRRGTRSTPIKGRGRLSQEGVQKLKELQLKLRCQSQKTEAEVSKIISSLQKQGRVISNEIDKKRSLVDRI